MYDDTTAKEWEVLQGDTDLIGYCDQHLGTLVRKCIGYCDYFPKSQKPISELKPYCLVTTCQ